MNTVRNTTNSDQRREAAVGPGSSSGDARPGARGLSGAGGSPLDDAPDGPAARTIFSPATLPSEEDPSGMQAIPVVDATGGEEPLSVSEVTALVKARLEPVFRNVWIVGEISNLSRPASGHVYLTLKDDDAQLRGVVWRGSLPFLAVEPADGLAVACHGRIEVYAARGTYQVVIDRMHALGTGPLEARLRRLRAALEAEGLFSPLRKRPLPELPARIALVTSPTGAAIADFLTTLHARYRPCEVTVVPSRVQGAGAAAELARGLERAINCTPAPEVVVLVRGGGSLEDLWAFNEEVLVRAIAASPIPVVTGVGHEVDVTLADLAADVRGLTPTDAAVRIAPDSREILERLEAARSRLGRGLVAAAISSRRRLESIVRAGGLATPEVALGRLLAGARETLSGTSRRLVRGALAGSRRAGDASAAAIGRLHAASPLAILGRGYSVCWRDAPGGPALSSVEGLAPGDTIFSRLRDGMLAGRVTAVEPLPDPIGGPDETIRNPGNGGGHATKTARE
jgi:exodeoxyribonuclease VII large subunit